jgi:hypothetical protein
MLRTHYTSLKNQVTTGTPTFVPTGPESVQLVLETRFSQLATAISLELWSVKIFYFCVIFSGSLQDY